MSTLSGFELGSEADNAYHRLSGAQVRKKMVTVTPPPPGRVSILEHYRQIDETIVKLARLNIAPHVKRMMRFWRRSADIERYTLTVHGQPAGSFVHYSRGAAEREAVRLTLKTGKPVSISMVVATAIPLPAPAPAVEIIETITGEQAFYNSPREVHHRTYDEKRRIDLMLRERTSHEA